LQFERFDPLMLKFTPVLSDIQAQSNLRDVLQAISQFNFHLYHRNSANPLKQKIKVVLQSLDSEKVSEEPIYFPDGRTDIPLAVDTENTVSAGTDHYGLTIKNGSDRNLFPYLMYFDPTDYSIQVLHVFMLVLHSMLTCLLSLGTTLLFPQWLRHLPPVLSFQSVTAKQMPNFSNFR